MSIINQLVDDMKELHFGDWEWRDGEIILPDPNEHKFIIVRCKKKHLISLSVEGLEILRPLENVNIGKVYWTNGYYTLAIEKYWWIPANYLVHLKLPSDRI